MPPQNYNHGNLFSEGPRVRIDHPTSSSTDYLRPPLETAPEIEDLNSKFALSEEQRRFLLEKDVENRREKNDGVLAKRDRLPERIQYLIDDVTLIQHNSLFSENLWQEGLVEHRDGKYGLSERVLRAEELDEVDLSGGESERYETPYSSREDLWEELIDVPKQGQWIRDDVFFHGAPVTNNEIQLGFELGSLLHMIRPADYQSGVNSRGEYDNEITAPGIICGFLLAFIGSTKDDLEEEKRKSDALFEMFNKLNKARKEEAKRMTTLEDKKQTRSAIKDGINEVGFTPHRNIISEVELHLTEYGIERCSTEREEYKHRKREAKSIVEKINELTPLAEAETLNEDVSEDVTTVLDRGASGIESIANPLQFLWWSYTSAKGIDAELDIEPQDEDTLLDKPTSGNLGRESNKNKSTISEVFNRISNHESETWTNQEILTRNNSGERGVVWDVTPYGVLVCHSIFEYNGDTEWLYHYAIGPEELCLYERVWISTAINELDLIRSSVGDC